LDFNFFFNQYLFFAVLMICAAIPAGFMAGLFGIGGGLITVPVLYYVFDAADLNNNYLMHFAVGTSFSIIIPTSVSSVITHNKFNAVDFNIVKSFGLFVVAGVIFGAFFASILKTEQLILFFSIAIFFLGIYLIFLRNKKIESLSNFKIKYKIILGFISGFVSGQLGLGGAVMNVPILRFFGYSINKAIGSAAAIGFLISLTGAVSFSLIGGFKNVEEPLTIGFINIPAFLVFVPITILMAKIGAKTVHKIDKKIITKLFGLLNIIVSILLFFEYHNY
tara:strand:+ start:425 stop:1258 length:834 start_codon:yes stop_codon:yes gene_type:complete